MDAESKRILDAMHLSRMLVIGLDELEAHNAELVAVKPTRTQVEYCWTATPAVCLYVLETEPDVEQITYLDADLMFFREPQPLYDEMGDASILIVPHRYAPQWKHHEPTSGIYNVQFMVFRRDEHGLGALQWWHDRCIEWCYYRVEDGKLGDQKYLDDWPDRFDGVHVLEHVGGGLAPWNVAQYRLEKTEDGITVDGRPLIFYHYHSLTMYRGVTLMRLMGLLSDQYQLTRRPVPIVWRENYPMSPEEHELVWDPYVQELGGVLHGLRAREGDFTAGFVYIDPRPILRAGVNRMLAPARRVRGYSLGAARRLLPGPRGSHRESWKRPDVARQMELLTTGELQREDAIAPYRAFLGAVETLIQEHDLPEPARLLDFGCGVGHYSELLERHFPGRFEYTGCDFSEAMIETARRRWPDRQFVVNDIFANTLDLNEYDVIVAGALLDVLDDWEPALDILLGSQATYVLLHRQQIALDGDSHVEVVPGYDGQTTYRMYLSRRDLESITRRNGRALVRDIEVDGPLRTLLFEKVVV